MILENISSLKLGSHKPIRIRCDFRESSKCRFEFMRPYREILSYRAKNNNKDICLYCSRKIKFSGRDNPNSKYELDDNLLENIDSEGKAYLLGWIASDGSVCANGAITISVHKKDEDLFNTIFRIIGYRSKLSRRGNMVSLRLCSTKMMNDVCRHLNISPGKKSHVVEFPVNIDDKWKWSFIRGYFDGDGYIRNPGRSRQSTFISPEAGISSCSKKMRNSILEFSGIPGNNDDINNSVSWYSNNALDFLGKLYDGCSFYLDRKFDLYCNIKTWVPGLSGSGNYVKFPKIRCVKTRSDAVLPTKNRVSDSGYDVTIVEKVKEVGDVEFYDTGIKVHIDYGWWLMLVPRSSLSKTDYMLANGVGIIDRTYSGNILVALRKMTPTAKLPLPCRIGQLIPMPAVHFDVVEVDELQLTERASGGFGSTG